MKAGDNLASFDLLTNKLYNVDKLVGLSDPMKSLSPLWMVSKSLACIRAATECNAAKMINVHPKITSYIVRGFNPRGSTDNFKASCAVIVY